MIKLYENLPYFLARQPNLLKKSNLKIFFYLKKIYNKIKFIQTVTARNYTNTIPDQILEKARRSKLGAVAKGPSVDPEDVPIFNQTKYTQADRDYK